MKTRLKRPLNPAATRTANAELYERYPELIEGGTPRSLDVFDVADAPYRAHWREIYLRHGGELEEADADSAIERTAELGTDRQPCPQEPCKIPIIVLPGIMGSRLKFTSIGQYWDPDWLHRMFHWIKADPETLRSELHFQTDAKVMTGLSRADDDHGRGWAGLSDKYYGLMLKNLEMYGRDMFKDRGVTCPVYGIGYDFRQSNADSALAVAERVDAILDETKAEKFILVTHSMGGLVARSMLHKRDDLQAKTLAVLHVMQPAHGAPIFYRYLLEGADDELGYVLGDVGYEFLTVASGQRGAVELLPTNDYRCHPHGENARTYVDWLGWSHEGASVDVGVMLGDVYKMYLGDRWETPGLLYLTDLLDLNRKPKGQQLLTPEMKLRITEAQAFHGDLKTFSLRDITWCIYSTNHKTCTSMRMHMRTPEQIRRQRLRYRIETLHEIEPDMQRNGDDTVPEQSSDGRYLTDRKGISVPSSGHSKGCTDINIIVTACQVIDKVVTEYATGLK